MTATEEVGACVLSGIQQHLLRMLLAGSISREHADEIVGVSNTPDQIFKLRGYGLVIPCELVKTINRRGRKTVFGRYALTSPDRQKAHDLLAGRRLPIAHSPTEEQPDATSEDL